MFITRITMESTVVIEDTLLHEQIVQCDNVKWWPGLKRY